MKRNTILTCIILLLLTVNTWAQKVQSQYTDINKIDSLMTANPKPIIMLIGTKNCNYCIIEDHSIKKAIKKSHSDTLMYYVYFDAKTREQYILGGTTFKYKETGKGSGIHELASHLTGQYLPTFPTLLVWDKSFKLCYFREGLIKNSAIEKLIDIIKHSGATIEF